MELQSLINSGAITKQHFYSLIYVHRTGGSPVYATEAPDTTFYTCRDAGMQFYCYLFRLII